MTADQLHDRARGAYTIAGKAIAVKPHAGRHYAHNGAHRSKNAEEDGVEILFERVGHKKGLRGVEKKGLDSNEPLALKKDEM